MPNSAYRDMTKDELRRSAFLLLETSRDRWSDEYPQHHGLPKFSHEDRMVLLAEAQLLATLALTAPEKVTLAKS